MDMGSACSTLKLLLADYTFNYWPEGKVQMKRFQWLVLCIMELFLFLGCQKGNFSHDLIETLKWQRHMNPSWENTKI